MQIESAYGYFDKNMLRLEHALKSIDEHSTLTDMLKKKLVIHLEHEGDLWNVLPNNSTTLNLIVLQTVAIGVARRMQVDLERDFKPNHPGGAIGRNLNL